MVVPGTGGAAGGGAAAGGAGSFLVPTLSQPPVADVCLAHIHEIWLTISSCLTNLNQSNKLREVQKKLLLAAGGAAVIPGTGAGAVVVPGTGTAAMVRDDLNVMLGHNQCFYGYCPKTLSSCAGHWHSCHGKRSDHINII